jgi:hypothetical protein
MTKNPYCLTFNAGKNQLFPSAELSLDVTTLYSAEWTMTFHLTAMVPSAVRMLENQTGAAAGSTSHGAGTHASGPQIRA